MSKSVACIIYKNNKLFIAKRRPIGEMGGKWEFPGGKIEEGETPKIAIKREMLEEFGVIADAGEMISSAVFMHKQKECTVEAYEVFFEHEVDKSFDLTEHTEYKWVEPLEIKNLDFVDSDMKLYPEVLAYYKII